MTSRTKLITISTTIAEAVSTAQGGASELGEELRSWADNMPENMQNGDKYGEVDEAATALEEIEEPDCPAFLAELKFEFQTYPPKARASRSVRRDDYMNYAQQAVAVIEKCLDPNDDEEPPMRLTDAQKEEAESYRDEVQELIDAMEGVEFPSR